MPPWSSVFSPWWPGKDDCRSYCYNSSIARTMRSNPHALMRVNTLTIVGVGLIGGSIGLAAKRRGVAERVLGVGRQQASLDQARAVHAIDEGCLDLRTAARQSEMIVVCSPVDCIAGQVLTAAAECQRGALLTDAGSTKAAILRDLDGRLP